VAAAAILTGRCELEDGVAGRLGEVLYRGVLGCLEVRPRGASDADVLLEDGPGLVRADLPGGVVTAIARRARLTRPVARALWTQDIGP
jgi:hypothetical protein